MATSGPTPPPTASRSEAQRLAAIDEFQLFSITGDPQLDNVVKLAASICGCPIAMVTVVGEKEQRFIARTGIDRTGTPREVSFCHHAIMNDGLYEVPDATVTDQFKENPLVTGDPHIKFYAAIPIDMGNDLRVGTLCVLDHEPHKLSEAQAEQLAILGRVAKETLHRRKKHLEHERSQQMLEVLKEVNEEFINNKEDTRVMFDRILSKMLEVSRSEYGFIGEVLMRDGASYLKTHAITNIAWNEETRAFYDKHAPQGLEFTNLRSLFGHTLVTGEPVIANDPAHDDRRGGLPPGHPAMNHYLGIPIKDKQGALIGMAGLANKVGGYAQEDITFLSPILSTIATMIMALRAEHARHASEAQARDIAERLKQAQNVAHMGDWEYLVEGRRLRWSDELYAIYELPRAEESELSDLFLTVVHPDDAAQVRSASELVLSEGRPVDLEYRVQMKDGRVKTLMAYRVPVFNEEGAVIGVRGTDQDITVRHRSETMLLRYFDVSSDYLSIIDDEGRFAKAGGTLANVLGRTPSTLVGSSFLSMIVAEDQGSVSAALTELRSGAPRVQFKARLQSPAGDQKEVEWVASIDPSTTMVYATGNDVSMKEKLEEAIWKTQVEAEKARAKDVFMANMSHEIRTPLNAIIGFTDLLGQTTLSDAQSKHLDVISTASRNLSVIINDILDLAKLDGGKLDLERKPVSIEETVKQVVNMHTERARAKGLKLLFTMDQGLPAMIMADQTRLSQILINLVANALKFTEKGYVRVDVLELQRDSTSVGIRFVVSDTGIGIDPSKLNMIFDRFTQAESYTTRIYGGTGLGLNIVQSLVELYGGELSVESTPGKGSSFAFEIVFPICGVDAVVKPAKTTLSKDGDALKGLHIMLVEDNEHNQILARTYLERNGALVDIVGNGMMAIQHLHSAKPDLILMDIQMPVMDGIQTTEVMRKDIGTKVPIVACSAHALASEKQRCLSVGMNDYLTKPYSERGLVDIILQNVKSNGASAGAATGSGAPSWFEELKEDIGVEAAEKMRMTLHRSLDRWHALLTKDLDGRDVAELLITTHNMAGSLGAVRLTEARQLAKECELACDSGDAEKALKLGAELMSWVEGMKQRM